MQAAFAHDIATAYGDATHADATTCAALAGFVAGLPFATIAHPFALARRLAAADFGDDALHGPSACGDITARADVLRSLLAPISRDAARFHRSQLPLPLPCLSMMETAMPDVPADDTAPDAAASRSPDDSLRPLYADPVNHDVPTAAPGLVSYRLMTRYGYLGIGAMSAAEAMREAARSTHWPDRAALEVWSDPDGRFIPALPDFSEGAPASRDDFWRVFAAHTAGFYADGTLPRPSGYRSLPLPSYRELGVKLAQSMRSRVERGYPVDTTGPAFVATFKTFGLRFRNLRRVLDFISGLAS